jgi:hypothetical protein
MTLRLDWQANPASEFVTSYMIFQSKDGGAMTLLTSTPDNFYEIVDPPSGVYAFTIRAVNLAGVSEMSDIAYGPGLPSKPSTPMITVM